MAQFTEPAAKRICVGLLAHVDAGKTTLAEAMMYEAGLLKTPGRVDHGNTALDYSPLERERGITIFASQACIRYRDWALTLLDTPGHVDFSAETERILQVLDCAVLVISGIDGVQAHTKTLWQLLEHYHIPTVIFVTKMDLERTDRTQMIGMLRSELSERCVDFSPESTEREESLAMCREDLLDSFLDTGAVPQDAVRELVGSRDVFPCWFGSGLKLQGIDAFLTGLTDCLPFPMYPDAFGASVFKITHDAQGNRLAHMKITGGSLRARDTLFTGEKEEKITQLRSYTGGKYTSLEEVCAGQVCAAVGLSSVEAGQRFGFQQSTVPPVLEPVMEYCVGLPKDTDPRVMMQKLRQLEEEDPMLRLHWDPRLQEIRVRLMGAVQAEILKSLILERFDTDVEIGHGHVVYKETIEATVEGVGHYEPLRHYAEVHLLLEPLERGSGIVAASSCSEDELDRNWQRLILTHILEKEHLGVLIGAPITDVKITLAAGRAHLKHTEGGDFRQATYRAVRQGLMQAKSILLEPWYRFRLEVPSEQIGRAITDIRARSGSFDSPQDLGGMSLLCGRAPVSSMNDYATVLASYTHGIGRISLIPDGYDVCHNADQVISSAGYHAENDLENTPDSVFCAHGGGFTVKWDQVFRQMHVESVLSKRQKPDPALRCRRRISIDEKELQAILEREFGPIKRPVYSAPKPVSAERTTASANPVVRSPRYQIVDGFNVIYAWPELDEIAKTDLEAARLRLMDILANYSSFTGAETILVFDAYQVKGGKGEKLDYHGINVVYTKENETADAYIERLLHEIGKNELVRLVTSDAMIQVSALRSGVMRVSAREFENEIDSVYGDIETYLKTLNRQKLGSIGENLSGSSGADPLSAGKYTKKE